MLKIPTHSFMVPKSMSSEVENIELKSKEKNNTDKLILSGQIVRSFITCCFSGTYKPFGQPSGQIQFVRVLKIFPLNSLVSYP